MSKLVGVCVLLVLPKLCRCLRIYDDAFAHSNMWSMRKCGIEV